MSHLQTTLYIDNLSEYDDDQNIISTGGVTRRSNARNMALMRREANLNRNALQQVILLSENDVGNDVDENVENDVEDDDRNTQIPEWWAVWYERIQITHPDWNNETIDNYLHELWEELSVGEQREFSSRIEQEREYTSQGRDIVSEEVLDSGYLSIPLPPPPKIIPDTHPDGEDELGINGLTCIVCMENKVKIFPHCGHVCACIKCSKSICLSTGKCPLCREYWYDLRMVYFP